MSQTAYPLKTDDVKLVVAQFGKAAFAERTEIHADGCQHIAKAIRHDDLPEGFGPDDGYGDDYYDVAPCARGSRTRNKLVFA